MTIVIFFSAFDRLRDSSANMIAQSLNKWNEPRNCPLTPGSDGPESGALHLFWRNIHRLGATKKLIGVHLLRDLSALQQWDKQILKSPFYNTWKSCLNLEEQHRPFHANQSKVTIRKMFLMNGMVFKHTFIS